jgi:DNA replication initiation complex subunit (GINS family)
MDTLIINTGTLCSMILISASSGFCMGIFTCLWIVCSAHKLIMKVRKDIIKSIADDNLHSSNDENSGSSDADEYIKKSPSEPSTSSSDADEHIDKSPPEPINDADKTKTAFQKPGEPSFEYHEDFLQHKSVLPRKSLGGRYVAVDDIGSIPLTVDSW